MTNTVWIMKADGTKQCGQGKEITLEDMADELSSLGPKVLDSKKENDGAIHPSVCGANTGKVNAYEISVEDWETLKSSFVGASGFRLLHSSSSSGVGNISDHTSSLKHPVLVRELIGRPSRCYQQGDALTKDYVENRVNIEHNKDGDISDIWFG